MASSNFRNGLKFGKISRKDLLCTKMQKNGYREFHHSSTLNFNIDIGENVLFKIYRNQYSTVFCNLSHNFCCQYKIAACSGGPLLGEGVVLIKKNFKLYSPQQPPFQVLVQYQDYKLVYQLRTEVRILRILYIYADSFNEIYKRFVYGILQCQVYIVLVIAYCFHKVRVSIKKSSIHLDESILLEWLTFGEGNGCYLHPYCPVVSMQIFLAVKTSNLFVLTARNIFAFLYSQQNYSVHTRSCLSIAERNKFPEKACICQGVH